MIFQLLGAVKAVVFFTPLPVNITIAGNFVELVVDDFEGVIEGVSATLGVAVGREAIFIFVPWFVFVVCVSLNPRQAVHISAKPAIAATMKRYLLDLLKILLTVLNVLDCCL